MELLSQGSVGIHVVERVLVQEILADGTGRLHLQAVCRRQSVHTYHLYDLLQLRLLLEKAHHALTAGHPLRRHLFVKPFSHIVHIEGIAGQPVDGREMSLIGQGGIQSPEDLDNAEGGLGHRLRDISSWRRYGSDG